MPPLSNDQDQHLPLTPSSKGTFPALMLNSQAAQVVDPALFSEDRLQAAKQISEQVNFSDRTASSLFGAQEMRSYNTALDQLMSGIRVKDAQSVGNLISNRQQDDVGRDIGHAVKIMRLKSMRRELDVGSTRAVLARLPVVGRYVSVIQQFVRRHAEFSDVINQIGRRQRRRIIEITEHQSRAEALLAAVDQQYAQIAILIVAGEQALTRGQAEFERLQAQAQGSHDTMLVSRLHAMHEDLMAFDHRLLMIKTMYAKAPVVAQELRLQLSSGQRMIEAIQNALDFTLSDIRVAIIQVAGLYCYQNANKERQNIVAIEREIAGMKSGLLESTYLASKRTQQEAVERIDHLTSLMEKVANLTRQGLAMDAEGVQARKEAQDKLVLAMKHYHGAMQLLQSTGAASPIPR